MNLTSQSCEKKTETAWTSCSAV